MLGRKIGLIALSLMLTSASYAKTTAYAYQIGPIPAQIQQLMRQYTWHEGCPVPLADLSYLRLSYWGFDNKPHMGEMIVNKKLGPEVVGIFKNLYTQRFPIERMELMDQFKGSDDAAMAVNNTSAFNCRAITGKPGTFSKHSYGAAIDINTLINPYVRGDYVAPLAGRAHLDRSKLAVGMIGKGDGVYMAFIQRGWKWGGDWTSPKDFQHFEKDLIPDPATSAG